MNDTRELDQIQQELDQLQSRSNQNKQTISAHEAVCQERYEHIAKTLETMHDKINKLEVLATQGRSSLRTLWYAGALVSAAAALFILYHKYFQNEFFQNSC